ncbi:MAG: alpha/beta hydrolase, partial [Bacteroidota bacterium]
GIELIGKSIRMLTQRISQRVGFRLLRSFAPSKNFKPRMYRLVLLLVLISTWLSAQEFTTLSYHSNDSIKLELDLFLPEVIDGQAVPLVIFVHGGGFSGGDRNGGHRLGSALRQQGIATASISYTLSMKGRTQDWGCNGILKEKLKTLQLAATETWLATDFLYKNASQYGLDTASFFLGGISAGAETIFHAAYFDRTAMALIEHQLSQKFRYAGIISGAGAIVDLNLITEQNQIPTMVFHGDEDKLVPYGTAAHHYCPPNSSGWLMLFGSAAVTDHLQALRGSFQLFTFTGAGHGVCGHFFHQEPEAIIAFVKRVGQREHFQERIIRNKP